MFHLVLCHGCCRGWPGLAWLPQLTWPPHLATKLEPQPQEDAALGLASITNADRIKSDSKPTVRQCEVGRGRAGVRPSKALKAGVWQATERQELQGSVQGRRCMAAVVSMPPQQGANRAELAVEINMIWLHVSGVTRVCAHGPPAEAARHPTKTPAPPKGRL